MSDQVTITPEMVSDREDHKSAIDDQYPDHLVTFDGPDDPYNPMNWPFRKKFITTISYGLTTCWITLASAIFAAAIEPVSAEFNVNTETSAAATSLLVFGFGLGPLAWGPLSELYGRKWLILIDEEWDVSFKELYQKYFIRPFQMMATPICFLMSLYASFVYGILYANLEIFSIEYQEVRQWGPVVGTLPFIALLIGILVAAAVNIYNNKYYRRRLVENGYRAVPEARLPPMMVGGIVFAAGQFLFAWTSSPRINYWPSIIGIALTGLGFTTIFQSALGYLIDTFTQYSASAVAANTFMRSMFSGAFPLFIIPMYHKLGVNWGTTVFGCIAAALIPVPYLFFVWGKRIRGRGKWSKESL
ncbi:Uncharacterized protein Y057_7311 [Fusarium fujikuroi]|nr:Uncharacterized protein Y057_7311 [Fusarium fujikuroi]